MLFPTVQFAAFFAVVFAVSWRLMAHQRAWRRFILVASYFFYSCADWRFVILLIASTVVNQVAATASARAPAAQVRKTAFTVAIVFDLGILAVFKYFDFFIGSVNQILGVIGLGAPLQLLHIALPVGVSFYTFQAISYVADVYRGRCPLARPLDYAIYASFFPHLVAGPIVRPGEFIPQLARPRDPARIPAARALSLIAGGLFKKVVLADMLGTRIVDPVFGAPAAHSAAEAAAAIYGYAVQIYCDFSGYTDMAIGLALLLGFRFPDNFDRPYAASSLQDFWRRWHMTLSRWLRDYLYIPLGGSRRGLRRTYVNLILTMLLGGLWHGAAWTFVIWGGIHGGGLAIQRWWPDRQPVGLSRERLQAVRLPGESAPGQLAPGQLAPGQLAPGQLAPGQLAPGQPAHRERAGWRFRRTACWLLTFNLVCLAWVFFRAPDLRTAFTLLGRLAALGPAPSVTPGVIIMIGIGLATQMPRPGAWRQVRDRFVLLPPAAQGVMLGIFLVVITAIVDQQGVAPFIYFRF